MTIEYLAELRRQYRAMHAGEPAANRAPPPTPAPPGAEALPDRIERVRRAVMIRALDDELARRNTALARLSRRFHAGCGERHEADAAVVVPFPGPRVR